MEFYSLDFFGLKRKLPITHVSPRHRIANFNILGDVEFTEKAGELLEQKLKNLGIRPDCFVGPEVKVVPFVHHMAKRFNHLRYVILRKSIRGYMTDPLIENPNYTSPKHVKKLVLSRNDKDFLKDKKVVLVDDVVSTGATIELLEGLMKKVEAKVLAKCAILKQGDRYQGKLVFLATIPIFDTHS